MATLRTIASIVPGAAVCGLPCGDGRVGDAMLSNGAAMTGAPLHQLKAEFFRVLGHPVRVRVLELLGEGELPVSALLRTLDIEHAYLSQQLAVLRRAGLVTSRRVGSAVHCSLSSPRVADLLAAARVVIGEVLSEKAALLAELQASPPRVPGPDH